MILTDKKIKVSHEMMRDHGMTRYGEYGVPIRRDNTWYGVCWKNIVELTDDDFDVIENYFLEKAAESNGEKLDSTPPPRRR